MPSKTSKTKSKEDLAALEGGPDAGVSKKRSREEEEEFEFEGKEAKMKEMAAEIEELKTENRQLKQKVST